jgi:hypothetical protein
MVTLAMMHGFAAVFSRPRLRLLHLAAPLQRKNRNFLMIDHLQNGGFGALQRSPPAATTALSAPHTTPMDSPLPPGVLTCFIAHTLRHI